MLWKKSSTNYSKWDYFASSSEDEEPETDPILPKNDPNFMAMEADLKKREENKQKKLSILNDKTVEENQLISNLKKAGIKNNLMDVEENKEDENMYDINNMYDNEEKNEKQLSAIDEDTDDESMMYEDMGFLYS